MEKTFAGARLRQLRAERRLSQIDMARQLEVSASYLNQLEHNSRPLTVPVLLRISDLFGVDAGFFAPQDPTRLIAELRDALSDADTGTPPAASDIAQVATEHPSVAQAVLALHRRYRSLADQLATATQEQPDRATLMPHEEVRDFFYDRGNYVDSLDRAAELYADKIGLNTEPKRDALIRRLLDTHGVRVVVAHDPDPNANELSRFDRGTQTIRLSPQLLWGQQIFRLAHQLANFEFTDEIDNVLDQATFLDPQTRPLLAIGLANYVASAMVLPYTIFRDTAEEFRYDIERLSAHFNLGFESTCHRLSTLQRPRARGIPFAFVRVDRAGNMSQRQSATAFHFSRAGGTCPLWNVYEAFASPGKLLTQIAEMPDGRRYLWMARTVYRSPQRYGAPGKLFAVALGCEIRHASRLVYSAGLNPRDPNAATPIGVGCKVCERTNCPQRAFPPVGQPLDIDPDRGTFIPYPIRQRT
ncbi:MAG: Transcriptional regulator, family [Pseudonocardiales bacterium]|nr:Transcriptional regulator, family [Pseudonocardiales bacterium]